MNPSKVLMITMHTKLESWLAPMREAGIDAQVDSGPLVSGGQDVMGSIHSTAPDLVIVDVSDARIDGAALISQIRGNPQTRSVLIILFGCHADERERTAGLDAGADDFLAGQISVRELIARVRAVLRRGSRR